MIPSGDEFRDEGPFVAMFCVEVDEIILLDGGPLVLVDAPLQVVVVSLPALLPVAVLNAILDLHYFGDLAPFFNFPLLEDFFQNFVFLCLQQLIPTVSIFSFRT